MFSTENVTRDFLSAWGANDRARMEELCADEVGLRLWGHTWIETHRPRARVLARLLDEWAAWPDASLEIINVVPGPETADSKGQTRAAAEFRIQGTERGEYMEHNRAAFLTLRESKIELIELYDSAPFRSAHRKGWMAPANMTEAEVRHLLEEYESLDDPREQVWPNSSGRFNCQIGMFGSGLPHPGSNGIGGSRWSPEEAEAAIEATIDYFRRQNAGFRWFVGPNDTPADLALRLERHGLVLAGSHAFMVRLGLDPSDVPFNPEVEVVRVEGGDDRGLDDLLEIQGQTFHMTAEQIAERRPGFAERLNDPRFKDEDITYLARIGGKPVAYARVLLKGGSAYLSGAGTLPEYRNRKVYSTLLRRRLQDAHDRGFAVAMIRAGPMSHRVVEKYGFREYGNERVYAWMPQMDVAVIRSLVPDE